MITRQRSTEPDLDLLYAEARAQLDRQLDNWDALDAKLGVLFAFAGAEVAAVAAFLALPHSTTRTLYLTLPIALFFGTYLALAVTSILALRFSGAVAGPDLAALSSVYVRGASQAVAKERVIETLWEAQIATRGPIAAKERALAISLFATVVQTVVVLLTGFLVVVANPYQSSPQGGDQRQTTPSSVPSATRPPAPSGQTPARSAPSSAPGTQRPGG